MIYFKKKKIYLLLKVIIIYLQGINKMLAFIL
jgi:hypothetical protein